MPGCVSIKCRSSCRPARPGAPFFPPHRPITMDLLDQLADAPPELIWGLLSRGLGLTYFISFASIATQLLAIAGRRGITPIAESLQAIRRDFPTWKRFFYFP